MQIGAVLPHNEIGTDPGAIKAYLQGVEELGMTHLLIYDHVMGVKRESGFKGPYDSDTAFHEPFAFFGFAAAVTERIELVTTVLILPQRQTVLVAKQAAEIALLSNNRLRLGVGTGWNKVEYTALNENFHNRGKRQAEQVELMRKLWTSDVFDYQGQYHTIENASINPRPTQPVPIWFGGSAPALLERCAKLGDGFMPLGGANDKSAAILAEIRRIREGAGLSMDGFGVQSQAQWAGGNPERWRAHASTWKEIGATHIAVATHQAELTDVDGHLARIAEYRDATADLFD
ncbi:MAG: LLM class F420-dependent oxidoreductase [Acidimicrobiales bacterium]